MPTIETTCLSTEANEGNEAGYSKRGICFTIRASRMGSQATAAVASSLPSASPSRQARWGRVARTIAQSQPRHAAPLSRGTRVRQSVAAKRRDSIARSAAQRNPGYRTTKNPKALKGRDSPTRRPVAISGTVARPGIMPFQLRRFVVTRTQGCTLGYGITHLRCYGTLTCGDDRSARSIPLARQSRC